MAGLSGEVPRSKEVLKAMDDVDEMCTRLGVPPIEDDDEKKMKLRRMPQHKVDKLLNYKFIGDSFPEIPTTSSLEGDVEDGVEKDIMTLFSAAEVLFKYNEDKIRAQQVKVRQEIETKGYATYMATGKEEERAAAFLATFDKEEKDEDQGPRGGGGRRRFRPGVVKKHGDVRKQN